ncbi:nicotinate phosphoribosyltransferase [Paracoccus sp. (in: a-proteobacteria)]|uniref:nicotinate phosphoribosyltransferase n=1 Tax=Paracoccus sp. TaxID=267 RepID=UPI00272BB404|nr:nicotinate phosphoribosyltransferase [Paracoccus sp. (in: a-proteobacteria)]
MARKPQSEANKPQPEPKRGMPRSLLYALIPGGFLLLVAIMVFGGWATQEEPAPMTEAREEAQEIDN